MYSISVAFLRATDITMTTILKPILVEEFLKERFNARDLHQLQARDYAKVNFYRTHFDFKYVGFMSEWMVINLIGSPGERHFEEYSGGDNSHGSVAFTQDYGVQ